MRSTKALKGTPAIKRNRPLPEIKTKLHKSFRIGKNTKFRQFHTLSKKEKNVVFLLFVYGSLKRGFDNHDILKGAKYIGNASTVNKFAMYEDKFGNYPFMVKQEKFNINGELYEIRGKELLKRIDEFEGAPDLYIREKIKVKTNNKTFDAFAYIRELSNSPYKLDELGTALNTWNNNVDAKVAEFKNFIANMI